MIVGAVLAETRLSFRRAARSLITPCDRSSTITAGTLATSMPRFRANVGVENRQHMIRACGHTPWGSTSTAACAGR
jgi:hypothetical protein